MFQLITNILIEFYECFNRKKTWQWFLIIVVGLMVRSNVHRGVTSIMSSLRLEPRLYHSMLNFFRSNAYRVSDLYKKWIKIALERGDIVRIAGRMVVVGDHIKMPKEARRMPDIQLLHQESENSGKAKFIEGHMFAQACTIITNGEVSRSLPLMTELQKSPPRIEGTKKPNGETLVTQMLNLIRKVAETTGEQVVAVLDAYFSSASAWAVADETLTEKGERVVEIVTRAQSNSVAYKVPKPPKKKKRGQPKKYGDKVYLHLLFKNTSKFTKTSMVLYGKKKNVKYQCLDLIWMPVKKLVRFVLVEMDGEQIVLMSTSLTLEPEDIITLYALRFKIETSFAEQKNEMGSFSYHFWSMLLPKRKKWQKNGEEPLLDDLSQKKVDGARKAIDSYVCLCTITAGILSIIAFSHNCEIWKRYPGWIRTLRSNIPTIAIVRETLAWELPEFLKYYPHSPIASIINLKRRFLKFIFADVA